MQYSSLTTEEHILLWNEFRSGAPVAFSRIYDLFAADLYRYGYNLVRDKPLVEDCIHELYLSLYLKRKHLGDTSNIRFYLFKSLRHMLLNAMQIIGRYDSSDYGFERAEFVILPFENKLIEQQWIAQRDEILIKELNKLPKRQREILYLLYLKGFSHQEASEIMNIAIKSVYNTVSRALNTLRKYVENSFRGEGVFIGFLFAAFICI